VEEVTSDDKRGAEKATSSAAASSSDGAGKEVGEDEEDNGELCSVCLCDYDDTDVLIRLPCEHLFHEACITRWLRQDSSCPQCRFNLQPPRSNVPTRILVNPTITVPVVAENVMAATAVAAPGAETGAETELTTLPWLPSASGEGAAAADAGVSASNTAGRQAPEPEEGTGAEFTAVAPVPV